MATATALGLQVALRVNDKSQSELAAADYLNFINMAIDDLHLAGWVLRQTEDTTSLSLLTQVYDYDVPAGFSSIKMLIVADPNGAFPASYMIPYHQWYIGANSPNPQFHFYPDAFDLLVNGRAVKIIGQKRFTGNLAGSDPIVVGTEGFVRERALAYAAEALSMGMDEQAQRRARIADTAWAKSQQMLGNHPREFRSQINGVPVPGRE